MAGYFIVHFTIDDSEAYEQYVGEVVDLIAKHDGKLLAADDAADVIEGSFEPGRVVVVEFPSVEAGRAWYKSPEYTGLAELRRKASTTHMMILIESFTPPQT